LRVDRTGAVRGLDGFLADIDSDGQPLPLLGAAEVLDRFMNGETRSHLGETVQPQSLSDDLRGRTNLVRGVRRELDMRFRRRTDNRCEGVLIPTYVFTGETIDWDYELNPHADPGRPPRLPPVRIVLPAVEYAGEDLIHYLPVLDEIDDPDA
jgi:hypothetical protein